MIVVIGYVFGGVNLLVLFFLFWIMMFDVVEGVEFYCE